MSQVIFFSTLEMKNWCLERLNTVPSVPRQLGWNLISLCSISSCQTERGVFKFPLSPTWPREHFTALPPLNFPKHLFHVLPWVCYSPPCLMAFCAHEMVTPHGQHLSCFDSSFPSMPSQVLCPYWSASYFYEWMTPLAADCLSQVLKVLKPCSLEWVISSRYPIWVGYLIRISFYVHNKKHILRRKTAKLRQCFL